MKETYKGQAAIDLIKQYLNIYFSVPPEEVLKIEFPTKHKPATVEDLLDEALTYFIQYQLRRKDESLYPGKKVLL